MRIFDSSLCPRRYGTDAIPLSDANWKQASAPTNSSFTVKGLTSGTEYWFRVCGFLVVQQSNGCDPSLYMAP